MAPGAIIFLALCRGDGDDRFAGAQEGDATGLVHRHHLGVGGAIGQGGLCRRLQGDAAALAPAVDAAGDGLLTPLCRRLYWLGRLSGFHRFRGRGGCGAVPGSGVSEFCGCVPFRRGGCFLLHFHRFDGFLHSRLNRLAQLLHHRFLHGGCGSGRGGGLPCQGHALADVHAVPPLHRVVAAGHAGHTAGLLEGDEIPRLVLDRVVNALVALAAPCAVGVGADFIIRIALFLAVQPAPVLGQAALLVVQVADDQLIPGALGHLVQVLQAVHTEAVAHRQDAQGLVLAGC